MDAADWYAPTVDDARYQEAVRRFFEAHEADPRRAEVDGRELPWAVHYHRRMAWWLDTLAPDAPEAVKLAVRCQHIRRWQHPRSEFPDGRAGYMKWRSLLGVFHADEAGRILREVGYGEEAVERVRDLLRKKGLRRDPDVQLLEDVACLVFMENQLADFARKYDEDKMLRILRKTWEKMTPQGHAAALELVDDLPDDVRALVERAVADE